MGLSARPMRLAPAHAAIYAATTHATAHSALAHGGNPAHVAVGGTRCCGGRVLAGLSGAIELKTSTTAPEPVRMEACRRTVGGKRCQRRDGCADGCLA